MTIQLPIDLESRVQAAVLSGRFASVDDAMAEAARLLLLDIDQRQQPATTPVKANDAALDPIWGLMRDDAELMDEIVADAYRQRREDSWRELDL